MAVVELELSSSATWAAATSRARRRRAAAMAAHGGRGPAKLLRRRYAQLRVTIIAGYFSIRVQHHLGKTRPARMQCVYLLIEY